MLELSLALSLHLGMHGGGEPNFFNPNLRYRYQDNYVAGIYYNSEFNVGAYAAYTDSIPYISEDLVYEIGAVAGYKSAPVLPFIRLKYKYFYIAPAAVKRTDYVDYGTVIGYEYKFF